MSLSLTHKHILVTGSTDGLGKATALQLAKEGAQIILHGRSKERVERVLQEFEKLYPSGSFDTVVCDLENPESIESAFSKIEKLDILINNAGIWLEGDTIDATPDRIITLTKVNTLAPLLITRILLPKLLQSDFGQILSVVSIAGVEIPAGYYHTIYTATKFALQGLTEGLAKEFYNKNLRIMGYYPGGMNTNFFAKSGKNYKNDEAWMFDVSESVEAMLFMLTRNKKITVKRMDLVNQKERE